MNARRIVAFATAAALPSPATAGYIFNQVALTGDPAPGAGGAEFSSLSSPRLNANGDVAFEAFLETGTTGPAVSEDNDNALFGPTAGPGAGLGDGFSQSRFHGVVANLTRVAPLGGAFVGNHSGVGLGWGHGTSRRTFGSVVNILALYGRRL